MPGTMGFSSVITAAGALAGGAMQASAQRRQSAAYRQAADEQWKLARNSAEIITNTALENNRRSERNAQMRLAEARAAAGASHLMQEGSAVRRETDLATRLEDEISNATQAALQEANDTRTQALYDRRNLLMQADTARANSRISLLGGVVGAMGALTEDASSRKQR